jgi:hypothetical protein
MIEVGETFHPSVSSVSFFKHTNIYILLAIQSCSVALPSGHAKWLFVAVYERPENNLITEFLVPTLGRIVKSMTPC